MKGYISIGLILILLSGCVPFPHMVTSTPNIEGTITNADAPLANINVYLVPGLKEQCQVDTDSFALTDQNGQFVIEESSRWVLLYVPLVAPMSIAGFTLCVANSDQAIFGHRGFVSLYHDNATVRLKCDIGQPRKIMYPDGVSKEAVCYDPEYIERQAKYLKLMEGSKRIPQK